MGRSWVGPGISAPCVARASRKQARPPCHRSAPATGVHHERALHVAASLAGPLVNDEGAAWPQGPSITPYSHCFARSTRAIPAGPVPEGVVCASALARPFQGPPPGPGGQRTPRGVGPAHPGCQAGQSQVLISFSTHPIPSRMNASPSSF